MGQVNAKSKAKGEPSYENIVVTENVLRRLENVNNSSGHEPQRASQHQRQTTEPETYLIDSPGPALADQEGQLTQNKNYWKRRLEHLQENQEKIKQVMMVEKERGFEDVQGTLGKVQEQEGARPCMENLEEVASCYKEHTKEPLNCDKQVAAFVTCVKTFKN